MPSFLDQLNPEQKKAASIIDGPVLVLAGAGSGKTRTLTYRIANLIRTGIQGRQILAVTFTNKAAQEMQERVHEIIQKNLPKAKAPAAPPAWYLPNRENFPLIGTFHFFCLTVLREDIEKLGFAKNFVILDSNDQLALIKKIIKEQGLSPEEINPKIVHSVISNLKNNLITPQKFQNQVENRFDEQTQIVYKTYQKELLKNNAVDFDDIISHTIKIWENHPSILEKYRQRYPYLLVDEYQDTNHAQYRLISLLAQKNQNLFVVGDDYQSIYAWRGANIKNILSFEKDYPKAQVILLEQNYRSTQKILDAAQNVIDQNPRQKPKKLWTQNGPGASLTSYEAANEEDEALFIINTINQELAEKRKATYRDFAVLYRINSQSRAIEEQFLKKNIPYRIVGGIKFYERAEIKDMLAYLRLILNPNDQLSLIRIINVPQRSLGKATVEKLLGASRQLQLNYLETIRHLSKNPRKSPFTKAKLTQLKKFARLIEQLSKKAHAFSPKDLIKYILEKTSYKNFLLDGSEEGQNRLENVLELLSVAGKYQKIKPRVALEKFLEEVSLATSEENPEISQNTVTLMTLHAAKGLEFQYVFIPGTEEGLLPHSRSQNNPAEMEEERRLCYVGITRAMQKLWFIHTRNRRIFGQTTMSTPSRFLADIPPASLKKEASPPTYHELSDYPQTDSDFWQDNTVTYL